VYKKGEKKKNATFSRVSIVEARMNIGIPKERRPYEFRVGLSPSGVEILSEQGHTIFVEDKAGIGAGFVNHEYERAHARIVYSAEEVFARADLLLKVGRPLKEELEWLQDGSILAGFLHFASAQRNKIDLLLGKNITAVAYEQIRLSDGTLPVLRPFSQIGGLMAAQTAARLLQNSWARM
jgi:alanine dehydrogenase